MPPSSESELLSLKIHIISDDAESLSHPGVGKEGISKLWDGDIVNLRIVIQNESFDRRGLRGQQSPCTGRLDPARDKSLIDVAYVRRPPRRPFFDTSIAPIWRLRTSTKQLRLVYDLPEERLKSDCDPSHELLSQLSLSFCIDDSSRMKEVVVIMMVMWAFV